MLIYPDYESLTRAVANDALVDRARQQAKPGKWKDTGSSAQHVWGRCASSGARYFETVYDRRRQQFFCNCPAGSMPCVHAVAMALMLLHDASAFPLSTIEPGWIVDRKVIRLVSGAGEKAQQRNRNREQRLQVMRTGLVDLQRWLSDVCLQGLGTWQLQDDEAWDEIATRMVDNKMRGIARRIRAMRDQRYNSDWHERLAVGMAELYAFSQGFDRLEELPQPLQQELLAISGLSANKKEVQEQGTKERDLWVVMGQEEGVQEQLRYQRAWLWGVNCQRAALLLEFVYIKAQFETSWKLGQAIRAELAFYPGALKLRAQIVRHEVQQEPVEQLGGSVDFAVFYRQFAEVVAANPWVGSFPVLVAGVKPVSSAGKRFLVDEKMQRMPIAAGQEAAWSKLLALSGGLPATVFGLWEEPGFKLLSCVSRQHIHSL